MREALAEAAVELADVALLGHIVTDHTVNSCYQGRYPLRAAQAMFAASVKRLRESRPAEDSAERLLVPVDALPSLTMSGMSFLVRLMLWPWQCLDPALRSPRWPDVALPLTEHPWQTCACVERAPCWLDAAGLPTLLPGRLSRSTSAFSRKAGLWVGHSDRARRPALAHDFARQPVEKHISLREDRDRVASIDPGPVHRGLADGDSAAPPSPRCMAYDRQHVTRADRRIMVELMRRGRFAAAIALVSSGVILVPVTARGQDPIPVRALEEELRIVSNDAVPGMRFTFVSTVTVLPDGRLVTVHAGERVARVFGPDGRLLEVVGGPGSRPGEFNRMSRVGYIADTLWFLDFGNRRYQLFGPSHAPAGTVPITPRGESFLGLTSTSTYLFRAGSGDSARIGIAAANGKVQMPIALSFPKVREGEANRMRPGTSGSVTIFRPLPVALSVSTHIQLTPNGREAIVLEAAEMSGGRPGQLALRRINTATGQISGPMIVPLEPVKLTRAEVDSMIEGAIRERPAMAAEYRARANLPEYFPAFGLFMVTADSTAWLAPHAEAGMPLVVDFSGTPLMRVSVPAGLRVLHASRTHVWGAFDGQAGPPTIVRYRITP